MKPDIHDFLAELDTGVLEELMDAHSANRLQPGMDIQDVVIQLNHGSMLFALDLLNLYHDWLMKRLDYDATE
ncbi:hypothetical protein M2475_002019 [Breznakia sp. PF5-3]|uniref:hypothetical protein n=1 Tax=unclassified Breznakia TaxID=2623764 RepID=UPI002406A60D|nr:MULTISPECIES: hypothetical protein [unclassified Breznakia]MDF9825619.1 hypothetical protein [Breznakia sp. PM6-1]MDF9836438.1 hypothetical protein [Breznakia sp. PF5-3]MDF9838975.1 hypothetical protein [Breznakia sp. PFB2-8]MDF9860995.1 hypothetical protein [Breznakia sp. PH5-24]